MLDRDRCNYPGDASLGQEWDHSGLRLSIRLSGQNMHDEDLCNIFAKLTIKHAPSSGLRPAIKLRGSLSKWSERLKLDWSWTVLEKLNWNSSEAWLLARVVIRWSPTGVCNPQWHRPMSDPGWWPLTSALSLSLHPDVTLQPGPIRHFSD